METQIESITSNSRLTEQEIVKSLLLFTANKISKLGKKGFVTESDKFEVLVTIKVKGDENAQ